MVVDPHRGHLRQLQLLLDFNRSVCPNPSIGVCNDLDFRYVINP
jgi:hypothetical protein